MDTFPPFTVSADAVLLVAEISALIERYTLRSEQQEALRLRKANRIQSIQSSLAIEGNMLSMTQVTDILEGRRVVAPLREIQEVKNAIAAYDLFAELDPYSVEDLLRVHGVMMEGLIEDAGCFRRGGVGVFAGGRAIHIAPPADRVLFLMRGLFGWLRGARDHLLIRSCVFHYEFELIHPFADGNGRMGRFWQSLILAQVHPLFQYLPIETMIHKCQQDYYRAINASSAANDSGPFIEFMLGEILRALRLHQRAPVRTQEELVGVVREYIRLHPGCRVNAMVDALGVSRRTLERVLQSLKREGVEFRGAPRNGGYYVKE